NYTQSTGKVKEMLDAVKAKLGMTPNMMKTMAQSPAVLEAYLRFSGALEGGKLNAKLRGQLALVSAAINGCSYCASAHTAIGKIVGLDEDTILAAREGTSTEAKTDAALKFARVILVNRGEIHDTDLDAVRAAGFDDGEIAEIIAHVAINTFTNYFNQIANTEIDFPQIPAGATA
ncbi:MAG: carboxymuconolactone decarboxylase family protein, partial [Methylococcales bacterium]